MLIVLSALRRTMNLTDDGPIIVEANEKPGLNAVQFLDGGCREKNS